MMALGPRHGHYASRLRVHLSGISAIIRAVLTDPAALHDP